MKLDLVESRLVKITSSVLSKIIPPVEIVLIILNRRESERSDLVTQLDSTALNGAGVGDVATAEDWFFLSRSNALTMSLSSTTSDEMVGVEEFELTLATTALAHDCRTFDLLSMIFKQSEGILSKNSPPAAKFNES
nr:hypothetical protein [Tanacetum cinerariifolium]